MGNLLVIQDPPHLRGSGLKLEASDVDATYTHRAFHLRIGSASEAIEVAFARVVRAWEIEAPLIKESFPPSEVIHASPHPMT